MGRARPTRSMNRVLAAIIAARMLGQGHNAQYLEQMYARYANDPNAVDESWRAFFKALGDDEAAVAALEAP